MSHSFTGWLVGYHHSVTGVLSYPTLAGFTDRLLAAAIILVVIQNALAILPLMLCAAVPGGLLGLILGWLTGQLSERQHWSRRAGLLFSGLSGLLGAVLLLPCLFIGIITVPPLLFAPFMLAK
jgi:hypothetical protein